MSRRLIRLFICSPVAYFSRSPSLSVCVRRVVRFSSLDMGHTKCHDHFWANSFSWRLTYSRLVLCVPHFFFKHNGNRFNGEAERKSFNYICVTELIIHNNPSLPRLYKTPSTHTHAHRVYVYIHNGIHFSPHSSLSLPPTFSAASHSLTKIYFLHGITVAAQISTEHENTSIYTDIHNVTQHIGYISFIPFSCVLCQCVFLFLLVCELSPSLVLLLLCVLCAT